MAIALLSVVLLCWSYYHVAGVERENERLRKTIQNQRDLFEAQLARAEITIQSLKAKLG